jgi:hypothetical protein
MLLGKAPRFGERLIPVDIGIVHQFVGGMAEAESVDALPDFVQRF